MRFLSTQTLVIAGIVLVAVLAFFAFGYWLARRRQRHAIGWGLVSAVSGPIGLIVLAILEPGGDARHGEAPERGRAQRRPAGSSERHGRGRPVRANGMAHEGGHEPGDPSVPLPASAEMRWRFLTEYDPGIRAAIAEVAPLGNAALAELKSAYLMVDDPATIPLILARIHEKARGAGPGPASDPFAPIPQRRVTRPLGQAPHIDSRDFAERRPRAGDDGSAHHERGRMNGAADFPPGERRARFHESGAAPEAPLPPEQSLRARLHGAAPVQSPRAPVNGTGAAPRRAPGHGGGLRNGAMAPEHDRAPLRQQAAARPEPRERTQPAPPGAHRTSVTARDLEGATYLETYRDIHLFQLRDGRVYVDKHLAVGSHEQARLAIDHIADLRARRA